jgi:hypothetical protein
LDDVEKEGDGGVGDEALVEPRLVKVDEEVKEEVVEEMKAEAVSKKKAAKGKKGKKAAVVKEEPDQAE